MKHEPTYEPTHTESTPTAPIANQTTKEKSLFHSTFIVSAMTATSRVSGFLRDLTFAHVFGAAAGLDAFLVAFRIPNFLRRLFAEGAFSQAFIPVLSEYRQQQSHAAIQLFLNRMAGSLIITLFAVTTLAVLVTPWLIWLFAPGFVHDPTRLQLATTMLRITFPYLFFISLTAYVGGILNSYGMFGIPSFTPNLLNFALIAAAIFIAPHFANPVIALAWGVFIGGVAQLLFQLPFLYKLKLPPKPQLCWSDTGVKQVLRLMLPAIFGVSVAQISFFVDTLLASFLRTGSLSWLYFSERLTSFPLGIFGVAIATVILPHLARKYATKSQAEFSQALDWGLKSVLILGLPAMLSIILLSGPILTTLLQYGKFLASDVTMAQRSLTAFAIGIPAFMLIKVLASGFYSQQNISTPVRIGIIAVASNIVLASALVFPLAHMGLALATALTSSLNAALLFRALWARKFYQPGKGWLAFLLRLGIGNLAMGLFLWLTSAPVSVWLKWGWFTRAWHLGAICTGAIAVYFVCLVLSGLKLRDFLTVSRGSV